jgi:GTP-binding protein
VNKWDLAKDVAVTGDYEGYLTSELAGLKFAPIAFTTATEGKNVQSILDLATEIFKQANTQISTGELNRAFESIKAEQGGSGRRKAGFPKFYYATQITTNPITILMFVNNPALFDESHQRYIVGRLRSILPIPEVPIRLLARSHRKKI